MFAHIETLSALAAAGTMTRAAIQLRITQSTVSKRIAALEREVGQPLVEACGRGVRLTPVGHRLLERATPSSPRCARRCAKKKSRGAVA